MPINELISEEMDPAKKSNNIMDLVTFYESVYNLLRHSGASQSLLAEIQFHINTLKEKEDQDHRFDGVSRDNPNILPPEN